MPKFFNHFSVVLQVLVRGFSIPYVKKGYSQAAILLQLAGCERRSDIVRALCRGDGDSGEHGSESELHGDCVCLVFAECLESNECEDYWR